MKKMENLDVIIPISLELDWPEKAEVVKEILEQHKCFGFTRFMLACPCGGWRTVGLPPESYYRERAELFRAVATELAPYGIECGWWITLSVRTGPDARWPRMTAKDGTLTPTASCPLNPEFRRIFGECTALFAEIAKPAFIITEDDFSTSASARQDGCFCEAHLREFALRQGRTYTREELKEIFDRTDEKSAELRRQWRELQRDSLAGLAAAMRAAVDVKSPEIPMGTMQSGAWGRDGDATEAVSRAMAGKRHVPFCRLFGSFYGGENLSDIPKVLFHPLYYREHLPQPFKFYYEADTFPHTRFFNSAASMRVRMTAVFAYGFDGATFQTQQLLDDANEEPVYGDMYREERAGFETIHRTAALCRLKGVGVEFNQTEAALDKENVSGWVTPLAHFGIPHTSATSPVIVLSGKQPAYLSRERLLEILSGGVIADGEAAKILCARGFSEYLGVKTGPDPAEGMNRFDLGGREIIEEGVIPESKGRHMHRPEFYAPDGNGSCVTLLPLDEKCEVLTRFVTFQRKDLGIGMTRFINKLGGRVAVMGMGTLHNHSSSLFNYRRQKLLQELVRWCADEFVMVRNAARVWPIMNEAVDASSDFIGMLVLSNLNPDGLSSVSLHLPPAWQKYGRIELLDEKGLWREIPCRAVQDGVELPIALPYARPAVLRFMR